MMLLVMVKGRSCWHDPWGRGQVENRIYLQNSLEIILAAGAAGVGQGRCLIPSDRGALCSFLVDQ
jgi:hypothetical protein